MAYKTSFKRTPLNSSLGDFAMVDHMANEGEKANSPEAAGERSPALPVLSKDAWELVQYPGYGTNCGQGCGSR